MDSQQAAFEKFKSSDASRASSGDGRAGRGGHGHGGGYSGPVPDLYSIHRGTVVRVEDFGAFVELPGFKRHGLVHKSQASRHFTEKIADVVAVGDAVWVKVTNLQDDKIALSMKYVSQGDGEDLDANLVQMTGEADKRRTHGGFFDKAPIAIEQGGVLLKATCKKCGAVGHLAAECFSGGEKFELLADEDDVVVPRAFGGGGNAEGGSKKKKDKEDRDRDRDRGRDHKKSKKEKKESTSSSHHRKEKRRERSRSTSPKRRSKGVKVDKVESLEDALALMRARKDRRSRTGEDEGRSRSDKRKRDRSSRSRSPRCRSPRCRSPRRRSPSPRRRSRSPRRKSRSPRPRSRSPRRSPHRS